MAWSTLETYPRLNKIIYNQEEITGMYEYLFRICRTRLHFEKDACKSWFDGFLQVIPIYND